MIRHRPGSISTQVLAYLRERGEVGATSAELREAFPEVKYSTLRRVLATLKADGLVMPPAVGPWRAVR